MNEFISQACINLRPEAGISIDENGIHWHNIKNEDIPSQEEIDAEANRLKLEFDSKEYQRKRIAEYPSVGDQLDAIWKGGDDAKKMLEIIKSVKSKYPKP